MIADLLHGGPEAAGFMTTRRHREHPAGGEGRAHARPRARHHARRKWCCRRPRTRPSRRAPRTSTCARCACRWAPTSGRRRGDGRCADANTVLVVASAPAYPQGVDRSRSAGSPRWPPTRDINCHVDACMGGITLPMLERLGYPIPPFDFRVAGRDVDLGRPAQVRLHGQGRVGDRCTATSTCARTRPSSPTTGSAACTPAPACSAPRAAGRSPPPGRCCTTWAKRAICASPAPRAPPPNSSRRPARHPGVRVLGTPAATLVAFTFDDVDTFAVGAALAERGWVSISSSRRPACTARSTRCTTPVIPEFLATLRSALDAVRGARAVQRAYGALGRRDGAGRRLASRRA